MDTYNYEDLSNLHDFLEAPQARRSSLRNVVPTHEMQKDAARYVVPRTMRVKERKPYVARAQDALLEGVPVAWIQRLIEDVRSGLTPRDGATKVSDLQVKHVLEHRLAFVSNYDINIAHLPFVKKTSIVAKNRSGSEMMKHGKPVYEKAFITYKKDADGHLHPQTGTFLGAATALVNKDTVNTPQKFMDALTNADNDKIPLPISEDRVPLKDIQTYQHEGPYAQLRTERQADNSVKVFGRPTSDTATAKRNFLKAAALHFDEELITKAALAGDPKKYLADAIETYNIAQGKGTHRAERKERALAKVDREIERRSDAHANRAFKRARHDSDVAASGVVSNGGRYYSYMDYPY